MSAIDPARDRMAVISGAGTGVGRAIAVMLRRMAP